MKLSEYKERLERLIVSYKRDTSEIGDNRRQAYQNALDLAKQITEIDINEFSCW